MTPSGANDVFHPMMVAGDDLGTPADSPAARVDANTSTSLFTGVGSVQTASKRGTYIGTGTLLTDSNASYSYVLTAGHVVDVNGDGKFDTKDGVNSLTFWFNIGGNQTASMKVSGQAMYSSVFVNPSYTGFNRPSVNDDLAVIRFVGAPPAGAASYSVYSGDLYHRVVTMVGYGRSGYGDVGYTTDASWSIKRVGQNVVDAFYGQDDAGKPAANEVFRFDFDGPTSTTNAFGDGGSVNGGLTLGNQVESTLGGGDSGGPSFNWIGGTPIVAGVNTFTQGFSAPKFGSLGGGIVVGAYLTWLQSVVPGLSVIGGEPNSAPSTVPGTGTQASLRQEPEGKPDGDAVSIPQAAQPAALEAFVPAAMVVAAAPAEPVIPAVAPATAPLVLGMAADERTALVTDPILVDLLHAPATARSSMPTGVIAVTEPSRDAGAVSVEPLQAGSLLAEIATHWEIDEQPGELNLQGSATFAAPLLATLAGFAAWANLGHEMAIRHPRIKVPASLPAARPGFAL